MASDNEEESHTGRGSSSDPGTATSFIYSEDEEDGSDDEVLKSHGEHANGNEHSHGGFAYNAAGCIYRFRWFFLIGWPVAALAMAWPAKLLIDNIVPLAKDPPHNTPSSEAKALFDDKFHYLVGMKKELVVFKCKNPCASAVNDMSAGLVEQVKDLIKRFEVENPGTIIHLDSYYTYGDKIEDNPMISHDQQSILLQWMWRVKGKMKFKALAFIDVLEDYIRKTNYDQDEMVLAATGPTFLNRAMMHTLIEEVPMHELETLWLPFTILALRLWSVKLLIVALCSMPVAILISFGIMYFVSLHTTVLTYSVMMMLMLNTALSFDYSLFTLTRYTEERRHGESVRDSIITVITQSGHVVVVSGLVLSIAYASMLVLPGAFKSFCVAACSMIITTIGVQLSFVPCVIAIFPWLGEGGCCGSPATKELTDGELMNAAMLANGSSGRKSALEKVEEHRKGIYYVFGKHLTACPLNIIVPCLIYAVFSPLTFRMCSFRMGHSFQLQLPRHRAEWETSLQIQRDFSSQVGCMMPMLIIGTNGVPLETTPAPYVITAGPYSTTSAAPAMTDATANETNGTSSSGASASNSTSRLRRLQSFPTTDTVDAVPSIPGALESSAPTPRAPVFAAMPTMAPTPPAMPVVIEQTLPPGPPNPTTPTRMPSVASTTSAPSTKRTAAPSAEQTPVPTPRSTSSARPSLAPTKIVDSGTTQANPSTQPSGTGSATVGKSVIMPGVPSVVTPDLPSMVNPTIPPRVGASQPASTPAPSPASQPASAPSTKLTRAIQAGASEIQVASEQGFGVGDTISISFGGLTETKHIAGFGSILLDSPVQNAFPVDAVVTLTAKAPSTTPTTTPMTTTSFMPLDVRGQEFFDANCQMVNALMSATNGKSYALKANDFQSATFHGTDAENGGVDCLNYRLTHMYRTSYFTHRFFFTSGLLQKLWQQLVSEERDAMLTILNPSMDPFSKEAFELVRDLRRVLNEQSLNATIAGLGFTTYSATSVIMDIIEATSTRLPYAFLTCVMICFILIALSFGAWLIPIKLMFTVVLPITWAYGAALLVYEDGWLTWTGLEVLSPEGDAGIDWTVPIFTLTIMLGLALDYDVFLFERVYEFRQEGFGDREAIQLGLSATGPIISSAGLIFAFTFLSMLLASMPVNNQIGFVFVFSIIVDTFIVRTILVPAMLSLNPALNYWPTKMRKPRYQWLDDE